MSDIERVYHSYDKWEDYQNGMYEKVCYMDDWSVVQMCRATLSCPELLESMMIHVSHHWICAAEHHLTNTNRNRQAWLGQAACCFLDGAPEYITKLAWHQLTEKQKEAANAVADSVIRDWEWKYKEGYFKRVSNGKNRFGKKSITGGSREDCANF